MQYESWADGLRYETHYGRVVLAGELPATVNRADGTVQAVPAWTSVSLACLHAWWKKRASAPSLSRSPRRFIVNLTIGSSWT